MKQLRNMGTKNRLRSRSLISVCGRVCKNGKTHKVDHAELPNAAAHCALGR